MALCVTTLLSMTAMVAAVKKMTPHSQYIKAIEVWLLSCDLFIFYALFAFLISIKIASFDKTLERAKNLRHPAHHSGVYTIAHQIFGGANHNQTVRGCYIGLWL
jgi:hypothetical protein